MALGAGVYAVARLRAKPAPAHPWFKARSGEHRPLVFAHQGGQNLYPSNTLLAFQRAAEMGADVLDADMHVTRDGVLVLMHDQTVNRTTDGKGAIRDLTFEEIRKLDAGYRFTTDRGATYPYRGRGLTVPTVEELFRAFPDKRFGVEIKQTTATAVQTFCDVIRRHHLEHTVLVSSFAQENMVAFRRACPEAATSATEREARVFVILSTLGLSDAYTPDFYSLQVPERSGSIHILTPRFVRHAHERNLAVQPWTINRPDDLKRMLALGVDGINTDNPDRLLELLKSQGRSGF